MRFGEDEKSVCPSSHHQEKGFFIAPVNGAGTVLCARQHYIGLRSGASRRIDQLWKKTLVS